MRTAWPYWFPPAFVHTSWSRGEPALTLSHQPRYTAAKTIGDISAATEVVEYLLKDKTIKNLRECICIDNTLVVNPSRGPNNTRNALPVVYANILANELELDICNSIFQIAGKRRDLTGFWGRFANPVFFDGGVIEGWDFILVDDVLTTGGTLAQLRGFIESKGGRVICMTAVASPSGSDVPIALDPATYSRLNESLGSELDSFLRAELGYGTDGLTEPEGVRLLQAGSVDTIRTRVSEASDN